MILLSESLHAFPSPLDLPPDQDIVGIGGDLDPQRLLLAYSLGIFPWYDANSTPILWQSPYTRFVLFPDQLKVNRSLRRALNQDLFEIRINSAFSEVLHHCASTPRPDQEGTWLNPELQKSFIELHHRGYAHSCEAWLEDKLVGGLYGLALGGVFFGESMFATQANASKVVFVHLVERLKAAGYPLIDCQAYTPHLERFGAVSIDRPYFIRLLQMMLRIQPTPIWNIHQREQREIQG